jgi:site-specific recombinase XerC
VTADTAEQPASPAPAGAAGPPIGAARRRRPPTAETQRLYAADWAVFERWCAAAGQCPLPADAATVAAYLQAAAATTSAGALARRASAITDKHRQRGFAAPTRDPAVKTVLRAARRSATPRRAPPPSPAQLVRMAAACPGDRRGVRDRALLLLAASGLRHATLLGLDAEHLHVTTTAVALTLDDAGAGGAGGSRISIPCHANPRLCPVQALREWLAASDTQFGPVFRKIDRWGTIEHHRLGANEVGRILARRTPRRMRRKPRTAA